MIFKEILPSLVLQPFVQNYLLVHWVTDVPAAFSIKPYPTRIEQSLNFFARGHIKNHNPLTGAVANITPNAIFGQQVTRLNFETLSQPDFLMLMVIFRPGAMHRLLGISSQELTTEFCDAEAVFSPALQAVNDQIANAKTYTEIIERAEEFLTMKVRNVKKETHGIDRIGQLLLENPSKFSLDWLANQACLSPRQFERKFSERMGIGPKLYSRISRFFQAFQYKETHPQVDWLTVALQFGYTDYYHLSKDFKHFGNVTPNILLQQNTQRPDILVDLRQ